MEDSYKSVDVACEEIEEWWVESGFQLPVLKPPDEPDEADESEDEQNPEGEKGDSDVAEINILSNSIDPDVPGIGSIVTLGGSASPPVLAIVDSISEEDGTCTVKYMDAAHGIYAVKGTQASFSIDELIISEFHANDAKKLQARSCAQCDFEEKAVMLKALLLCFFANAGILIKGDRMFRDWTSMEATEYLQTQVSGEIAPDLDALKWMLEMKLLSEELQYSTICLAAHFGKVDILEEFFEHRREYRLPQLVEIEHEWEPISGPMRMAIQNGQGKSIELLGKIAGACIQSHVVCSVIFQRLDFICTECLYQNSDDTFEPVVKGLVKVASDTGVLDNTWQGRSMAKYQVNALTWALFNGAQKCATVLIDAGWETRGTNYLSLTPLHYCAMSNFTELAAKILSEKRWAWSFEADAESVGAEDWVPMHPTIQSAADAALVDRKSFVFSRSRDYSEYWVNTPGKNKSAMTNLERKRAIAIELEARDAFLTSNRILISPLMRGAGTSREWNRDRL